MRLIRSGRGLSTYSAITTNFVSKLSINIGRSLKYMATSGLLPTPTTMDFMEPKTEKAIKKEREVTRRGRPHFDNIKEVIPYGIRLTSSLVASPASLFPRPDKGEGRQI